MFRKYVHHKNYLVGKGIYLNYYFIVMLLFAFDPLKQPLWVSSVVLLSLTLNFILAFWSYRQKKFWKRKRVLRRELILTESFLDRYMTNNHLSMEWYAHTNGLTSYLLKNDKFAEFAKTDKTFKTVFARRIYILNQLKKLNK